MTPAAQSTPVAVEVSNITYRYGSNVALDDVSLRIRPGTITGLIGRNGAGKTTLASLMAGFRKVQQGSVLVDKGTPWENPVISERVCFMRDMGGVIEDEKIGETLRVLTALRPNFDMSYFEELMAMFGVPLKTKPSKLSRGQRSSFAASIALASRCDLTIVDEIHLGMDAVARRLFYDALMADYITHPRTIIISSHLLDEIEDQLEDVIILHDGKLVDCGLADDVRAKHSCEGVASLTDILVNISGGAR